MRKTKIRQKDYPSWVRKVMKPGHIWTYLIGKGICRIFGHYIIIDDIDNEKFCTGCFKVFDRE